MVRRSAFDRILREMQEIRCRLDDIENSISRWNPQPLEISESELLSLPDHLRRTYLTVVSKGESNATEVANLTGRCRAIESNYLNQLVRIGWLTKRRDLKRTHFRLVSRRRLKKEKRANFDICRHKPVRLSKEFPTCQTNQRDTSVSRKMIVKCLSLDYDGTISPLEVSRNESHVPLETRVMLRQISRFTPVSIVTMKDLSFVIPRTPFAHAWSAIGGLEMQVGKRIVKRECLEPLLPSISLAINYARTHANALGVEIEEKQDSEGRAVAFCVDWRRTRDSEAAKREVEGVASYCEGLGLKVLRYPSQPFYDVYPVAPDKGRGMQDTLNELAVKSGVLYLGDSEMDNSAFQASDISVGVVHEEAPSQALDCDYLLKFEYVPSFLRILYANKLQFSSDFPMIEINPLKSAKGLGTVTAENDP